MQHPTSCIASDIIICNNETKITTQFLFWYVSKSRFCQGENYKPSSKSHHVTKIMGVHLNINIRNAMAKSERRCVHHTNVIKIFSSDYFQLDIFLPNLVNEKIHQWSCIS